MGKGEDGDSAGSFLASVPRTSGGRCKGAAPRGGPLPLARHNVDECLTAPPQERAGAPARHRAVRARSGGEGDDRRESRLTSKAVGAHAVRRMAGIISSLFDDFDDAPPTVDAYTEGYNLYCDRKSKGLTRKW